MARWKTSVCNGQSLQSTQLSLHYKHSQRSYSLPLQYIMVRQSTLFWLSSASSLVSFLTWVTSAGTSSPSIHRSPLNFQPRLYSKEEKFKLTRWRKRRSILWQLIWHLKRLFKSINYHLTCYSSQQALSISRLQNYSTQDSTCLTCLKLSGQKPSILEHRWLSGKLATYALWTCSWLPLESLDCYLLIGMALSISYSSQWSKQLSSQSTQLSWAW